MENKDREEMENAKSLPRKKRMCSAREKKALMKRINRGQYVSFKDLCRARLDIKYFGFTQE
jgi:hypothetical protein